MNITITQTSATSTASATGLSGAPTGIAGDTGSGANNSGGPPSGLTSSLGQNTTSAPQTFVTGVILPSSSPLPAEANVVAAASKGASSRTVIPQSSTPGTGNLTINNIAALPNNPRVAGLMTPQLAPPGSMMLSQPHAFDNICINVSVGTYPYGNRW